MLDDLQWAGSSSLRTFERLMNDPGLRGVLIVGIYRAEDVDAAHVLSSKIAEWRQQPQPPMRVALGPLTVYDLGELTGDMLRLAPEPSRELAVAVNALTGGNPFDTVETINALRRDGILSLGESGWQWDEAKVRHFVGRGNVMDLLAARIIRLPMLSREVLEFMACLDNAVECNLLRTAVGLSDDEFRARLHAALEDGLLVAEQRGGQDTVRFRHDRVQQAVLTAMDDSERGHRQLAMARRLAVEPAFQSDAAQQYLACADMLTEPEERRRAAQLFHNLAHSLAGAASYLLAERYLASASALLTAIDEPGDAALRLAIDTARHCALYSLGRVDESDPLYAAMQAHTVDPLDFVAPTCLQMRSLDMRGRLDDAMELGRRLLAQLGLHVPADYAVPDREKRLDALDEWVRLDSQEDHSQRAQIRDPRLLGIAKLLNRMVGSAYFRQDMSAFAWLLLESQRLWAEHGPCAELVASIGHVINLLTVLRQNWRTGFNVASHVLTVGEALGYEPQTSEARYRFAVYACAWFEPLEKAVDHATRAYQGLRAQGDASIACTSHAHLYSLSLDLAPSIDVLDAEIEAGLALCRRSGNFNMEMLHLLEQRLLRALAGRTNAPDGFDVEHLSERAGSRTCGTAASCWREVQSWTCTASLVVG